MDQFGVLVESIGFKSQSRSTPLSKLKAQPNQPTDKPNPHHHHHRHSAPPSTAGIDLDAFFVGPSGSSFDDHDIFGFNNSTNNNNNNNGINRSSSNDLLSGFDSNIFGGNTATDHFGQPSNPSYSDSSFLEDHFSIFQSAPSRVKESPSKNSSTFDELESFARGSSQNNGSELGGKISKDDITKVQDKLSNLKYPGNRGNAASGGNIKVSLPGKKGRGQTNAAKNTFVNEDSFGAWFSNDSQTNSTIGSKSDIKDNALDSLFGGKNQSNVENNTKQPSRVTKKPPSNTTHVDDFLFFGEPAPSAVEFHEIEGEPDERRRARFNQHMRTKERMAKALSEKNQRDLQAQHEQEERHRSAESMDGNIKRWAAGKEGNLRALLSSLQDVLWPGCGWQPVSLTDMITSVSVKKVYHKATLCVHPDKVQQKGATVQQKYIAEKVFDILKESWNKFNAEEMR